MEGESETNGIMRLRSVKAETDVRRHVQYVYLCFLSSFSNSLFLPFYFLTLEIKELKSGN